MSEKRVDEVGSLWKWLTSFFFGKSRYYVAYPPADISEIPEEELKPWEWCMEPEEYATYWQANRCCNYINRINGKIVAIVVEHRQDKPTYERETSEEC